MKLQGLSALAALLCIHLAASFAYPHGGRRLEVKVLDDQLFVQGYISTGADDQGGNPRPYHNALHDHWDFIPGPTVAAFNDLPGYDVFAPGESYVGDHGYPGGGVADLLAGESLQLTLMGGSKWENPPMTAPFGVPELVPLEQGEVISIGNAGGITDTTAMGTLTLVSSVNATGSRDLDLDYTIAAEPTGVLYVLEWVMSTSAAGIADSDSIFTILSPDPDPNDTGTGNPMLGMHHHSLHLERYLGLPILAGDFDVNGVYDCADIDALVAEVASGAHAASFDLTGDGQVDDADITEWLSAAGSRNLTSGSAYLRGDANLDGSVDGQDFVAWNTHKFTSAASWCSGDFNADGTIDGQDFVVWNDHKFTSADGLAAVPEPSLGAISVLVVLGSLMAARR